MKPRIALVNIHEPPRRGFTIYALPNGVYQAARYIRPGELINRRFFTLEDCYAFLHKHENHIVPDELEKSIHLPASAYV
jgi:hypothetical protein